ncbi:hypothetical protein CCACVL1_01515 [Corchorus capsularis]|uniref:Uncharacterized protein n=1 Tax=Corchorus capsularis TaxID=210143 RepID=A0A1R3KHJ0_COCAP|nr:hypothetical protein CCACVL1_01515 [Corchorus capsularis]
MECVACTGHQRLWPGQRHPKACL